MSTLRRTQATEASTVKSRRGPAAVPAEHVLVLFGATGDLARRKLLPGLFHLERAGLMPTEYRIVGTAPPDHSVQDRDVRDYVRGVLGEFARCEITEEDREAFVNRLSFAPASSEDPGELIETVSEVESAVGDAPRRLLYLAVPPAAVPSIVEMVGRCGLSQRARVIVEKPFGHDLDSARALNATLHAVFEERQIFRIDHFLGKEAVQNILSFRFANGLFEPVWNREHVEYMQIDVPEQLTIDGRGRFYEATGAFRDMVVTHLFQMLGFVAMEPPVEFDALSLREEKVNVFRSIESLDPSRVVFGQYDGYRQEPGVAPTRRWRRSRRSRCGLTIGAGRTFRVTCARARRSRRAAMS